jgi:hypothetical protein
MNNYRDIKEQAAKGFQPKAKPDANPVKDLNTIKKEFAEFCDLNHVDASIKQLDIGSMTPAELQNLINGFNSPNINRHIAIKKKLGLPITPAELEKQENQRVAPSPAKRKKLEMERLEAERHCKVAPIVAAEL